MFSKIYQILKSFSKTERYLFSGAFLVLIVALIFWVAGAFYGLTTDVPAGGGHYTEGIVGQPTAINPLIAASEADRDLIELVFADLGVLADTITPSKDNKTWTVALKEKLRWSDGENLTTADILFTIETIQNPETQSTLAKTWERVVPERLSDREIRFSLPNPHAFFADNLKKLKIAPRHIFASIPPANLRLSNYNLEPVSSGPYKLVNFRRRRDGFLSQYYFEANDRYAGSKSYIKSLTVKFFANATEALAAFNRRDIDGLGAIDPKNLDSLKTGHQLFSINMPRYYAIFINQSTHPALKESSVRNALLSATDKAKLVGEVFANHAMVINGPIPASLEGYDVSIYQNEKFDLTAAAQALDAAGWKTDEDSTRVKTVGKSKVKLEFSLTVPQISFLIDTAEILKNDWAKIGVRLNPIVASTQEINEIIKTRNYQMMLFGNILRGNPDVFSFWHSSQRFYPGLNLAIHANKKVDDLLESIRKDFNPDTRKKSLTKLQQLIYDDKPAIFLFSPNYLYAAPKNLGGFNQKFIVTPSDRFNDISSWYLKTARIFK